MRRTSQNGGKSQRARLGKRCERGCRFDGPKRILVHLTRTHDLFTCTCGTKCRKSLLKALHNQGQKGG
ncbi:hypothetical protein V1264_018548 [Littorina saxatilis]|uniref:Uncharacterized protein n=1 Tax=Littorina saxatilis TaxID=31220 RepID=A0AAN9GDJ7_9CAEN